MSGMSDHDCIECGAACTAQLYAAAVHEMRMQAAVATAALTRCDGLEAALRALFDQYDGVYDCVNGSGPYMSEPAGRALVQAREALEKWGRK